MLLIISEESSGYLQMRKHYLNDILRLLIIMVLILYFQKRSILDLLEIYELKSLSLCYQNLKTIKIIKSLIPINIHLSTLFDPEASVIADRLTFSYES